MKALISPKETSILHIVAWNGNPPQPITEAYANSCRVAQVEPDNKIFPVGGELFWTDCSDDCVADMFYYDTVQNAIFPIENAPIPAADNQPTTTGTQTA